MLHFLKFYKSILKISKYIEIQVRHVVSLRGTKKVLNNNNNTFLYYNWGVGWV